MYKVTVAPGRPTFRFGTAVEDVATSGPSRPAQADVLQCGTGLRHGVTVDRGTMTGIGPSR